MSAYSPPSTGGRENTSHTSGSTLPNANPPPLVSVPVKEDKWPRQWQSWACLIGCWLLMFNSWGIVNSYGTISAFYSQHLLPNTSILLLNLVGSTQSSIVLFLSFIVGRILDAGYSRYLIGTGAFLVSLGMFMLSIANGDGEYGDGHYGSIWATQGLITGLGMACFFVSSSQIVATWFVRKKGLAIGIVASGASIVRYLSAVIVVTSLISFMFARPNPDHRYREPERWMDKNIWLDSQAFRNKAFCWFMAAIALLFFGFYAVFFNLEEWAVSKGFGYKDRLTGERSPANAIRTFWLLSIMNASSTTGRLLSAALSDRLGALNIHLIVTIISSILVLTLWLLASSVKGAIAFVVIFGAFSGAVIGLPPASMAYILGPHLDQQAKLGQWTGMMYTGAAPFALTGPVIAGYLISKYGTFVTVQVWSGTCLLLSGFCMVVARSYNKKQQLEFERTWSRALSGVSTLSSIKSAEAAQEEAEKYENT